MHVSVIIPTFNRCESLQRAIESVKSQSYGDWDLWIVDDGSEDDTFAWAMGELSLQVPQKMNYVRTSRLGVSHARNLGIQLCRGPWVAFLDSDDEWLDHKLERQMQLARQGSLKIIHGEEIWIRNGVRVNPHKKHKKSGGRIFTRSVDFMLHEPSTVVIHRDLLYRGFV